MRSWTEGPQDAGTMLLHKINVLRIVFLAHYIGWGGAVACGAECDAKRGHDAATHDRGHAAAAAVR